MFIWEGVYPSKHETLTQCWYNVDPPSATLAQHCTNIGFMSRVCWYVTSTYAKVNRSNLVIASLKTKQLLAKGDSWTKRSGTPTACRQAGRQAAPLFFHTYSGEGEPLQAIEPPGREDEADYQGGVWCTPLVSARLLSGSGCRVKRWGG